MGRKMRLCSRKYRDWQKKSPKRSSKRPKTVKVEQKKKKSIPRPPRNDDEQSDDQEQRDNELSGSRQREEPTISSVHTNIKLPASWFDHTTSSDDSIRLFKVVDIPSSSVEPLVITHSIIVHADLSWKVFVHNHEVKRCSSLANIPLKLDEQSVNELITIVHKLHVCAGQPDSKFFTFVESKNGKLCNKSGSVAAFSDHYAPVSLNGEMFQSTVRTTNCELLVHGERCKPCSLYRKTLRVLHDRWCKRNSDELSSSSSHANNRYLNTPEKLAKVTNLRQRVRNAEVEVFKLKDMVRNLIEKSEAVDEGLHEDLTTIVNESTQEVQNAFPEGTFRRVFWDQQIENTKKSDARQYRWHPLMIKWCLNLKLMSSAAYHAMRSSGFITLPSERTLRDYTNYIKCVPGYQQEVVDMMRQESKCDELPEAKRYVTILLDEMKVKEDIVYDKFTGNVIGFCNLGTISDELLQLENTTDIHPPVAKQILAIMIRGVFFKFDFPLAHFSTEGVTADLLFPIVWEGIRVVESTGLKVIAVTADGASPNRKFFKMHDTGDIVYKTKNVYSSDDRYVYFISDPPHLIKTTRNCLSHSSNTGTPRSMCVSTM